MPIGFFELLISGLNCDEWYGVAGYELKADSITDNTINRIGQTVLV